jgi:hypothetical protein
MLALLLVASALAATTHATRKSVHSSVLLFNGRVRCSVSIDTPAEVGQPLRVRFRLHNISHDGIHVIWDVQHDTWLVINGSDGTTFDTRKAGGYGLGGGPLPYTSIAPGGTVASELLPFRVRWSGPLRITPGCGGEPQTLRSEHKRLPTLHVRVAPTTAPVSERAAVARVVANSGHLLDNCRPQVPGVAVDGVLDAPHGLAPPMHARCMISLSRERGFYDAHELIVTPPSLRVHVSRRYGQVFWPRNHGTWEAIAWEFVVTQHHAVTVSEDDIYGIKRGKHAEAPHWQWTRSGPVARSKDTTNCRFTTGGGTGGSWGAGGPNVFWVTACS